MDMPLSRFADPATRWVDVPTRSVQAAGIALPTGNSDPLPASR